MRKIKPKKGSKMGTTVTLTAEDLRTLGPMGRSKVLNAKLRLDVLRHQLCQVCGIQPGQRPDGARLLRLLEAMPQTVPRGEALWHLGAVINSSRQMTDFTPAQAHRLAEHVHQLATADALHALAWDRGVIVRNYLTYGLLVYEAERSIADWELAERCAREAVALLMKHAPGDSFLPEAFCKLGLVLLNRRDVNKRRERLREAEVWFLRAREEACVNKDTHSQRAALLNLGIVNDESSNEEPGRLLRAVDFFDELVRLEQTADSDPHYYRLALVNRGWALLRFPFDRQPKAVRDAIIDLTESVRLRREERQPDPLAHALYFLGLAHETLSRHESPQFHDQQALTAFNESLALYRQIRYQDGVSRVLHNLGLFYQNRRQFPEALKHFSAALPFRIGHATEEWETMGNIVDIRTEPGMMPFGDAEGDDELIAAIDDLAQRHFAQGTLELALRSHRYGLRLMAHAESAAQTDRALRVRAERAIQAAEAAWSAARDPLERYHLARWLGTFYAARGWLGVQMDESPEALLERTARGKARSFLAERQTATSLFALPVDKDAMRARLGREGRTAFIDLSTSALGTASLTVHLDSDGELVLSALALTPTENLVSGWLQHPERGWLSKLERFRAAPPDQQLDAMESCVAGMQEILETVYSELIGPSVRGLRGQGIQHLVFCVHGPLAALPLAAAWYLSDGEPRYLIEDFQSVALVPSLYNFVHAEEPRSIRRCLHVIGNERSLPPVARVDAQELCGQWRASHLAVEVMTGPTPRQFMEGLVQVDLLHAVCHGIFDPWRLDQSGIQVGDDELISCEHILGQREQIQVALVVLCACRSGRSRAEDFGAEWLGPAGVLLRAGVQSVLAGLWDVDYMATASLSRAFYHGIFASHRPAALALAEAMRAALQAGREAAAGLSTPPRVQAISDESSRLRMRRLLAAPWFWAGLQLISTSGPATAPR